MKSRIFDRYGRVAAIDSKYTGEEPNWDGCEEWPIEKFMRERSRMFNFYNYYCSQKDLFDDILKWMASNSYTKEDIKKVKSQGERCVNFVYHKIARALNLGMAATRDHDELVEYIDSKPGLSAQPHNDHTALKEAIDHTIRKSTPITTQSTQSTVEEPKSISPLERLSNKINDNIIAELENMIDDKGWTESKTRAEGLNLTSLLKANNIPVKGLTEVYAWLENYRVSLQNALDRDNEFDIEGWAFLKKPGIRQRLKLINDMILQLDKYSAANKTVRKPRVKKTRAADVQVKRLQYKESDDTYGLKSISPIKLPGSSKVLVFNAKSRRLAVYIADSPIEVKGTSLKGWNEDKSFSLTIRKPDDIMPIILKKTEKQFMKVINELKTKRGKVNGRINKDTILLRVL